MSRPFVNGCWPRVRVFSQEAPEAIHDSWLEVDDFPMQNNYSGPSSAPAGAPGSAPGDAPSRRAKVAKKSSDGSVYVDYKDVDDLRRLMSPNGKILSRKRIGANAREQRLIAQAIKRARFMALLPYTNATI